MNSPITYSLVLSGITAEEAVIKGLMGDDVQITQTELDGYEVRKQRLENIPEPAQSTIKEFWDDAGHPYPGAYAVVKKEGAKARVSIVTVPFSDRAKLKKVVVATGFWDFRDPHNVDEAWFHLVRLRELEIGGNIVVTEVPKNIDTLEPVEDRYWETETYKRGTEEMARQVLASRSTIEEMMGLNPEGINPSRAQKV